MCVLLLVGLQLRSLVPSFGSSSDSVAFYDYDRTVVPGRAILGYQQNNNQNSYLASSEDDQGVVTNKNYDNGPSEMPSYPYIQCVAYINKTHSQRINRDLHSWVQDHSVNQPNAQSVIIPDLRSLTVPSRTESSIEPLQHVSRKVARHSRPQSDHRSQLQPYKTHEVNYDDFIQTIDRKNDTLYLVSFKRDHLILPATAQNQTQRPKMSLILPASMANLNKSIQVPLNHVPMIKIDCEVEDTNIMQLCLKPRFRFASPETRTVALDFSSPDYENKSFVQTNTAVY